jgi:hypothetical protein
MYACIISVFELSCAGTGMAMDPFQVQGTLQLPLKFVVSLIISEWEQA